MSSSHPLPRNAALALMVYFAGYIMVGVTVGARLVLAPRFQDELREMVGWSAAVLLVGQLLCWRCGWAEFRRDSAGRGFARFFRVVILAPITLWQKPGPSGAS